MNFLGIWNTLWGIIGAIGTTVAVLIVLYQATPRRRRNARPPPSLFLELPVDIILYLFLEHLPPVSALALSLTCKSLSPLASCQAGKIRLSISDREAFLLILEKDVGHNRYYCHTCSILHFFSASEPYALASSTWKLSQDDCRHRALVYLTGSCITIGYHHVRLAMNRHFLGPPNGLALDKFQLEYPSRGPLYFQEIWSARILQDELFLSATRTLYRNQMTDQELRHAVDTDYHAICIHVDTIKHARYPIRALHLGSSSTGYFTPCRDVVESCSKCLTDYDTTVEQRWIKVKDGKEKQTRAYWFITITSYHRLGAGRSPSDAKWHAFSANGFLDQRTIQRDMVRYPPGSVRQVWKGAESS